MTSAGFGGLCATIAALIALRGVRERARIDRELHEADAARRDADARRKADLDAQVEERSRWWELAKTFEADIAAAPRGTDISDWAVAQYVALADDELANTRMQAIRLIRIADLMERRAQR